MGRRRWMLLLPAVGLLGLGGRLLFHLPARGADGRIVNGAFLDLERRLGRHLYAPTWLPEGVGIGPRGVVQGEKRILTDFSTPDTSLLILAQEPRTAERDRYHHGLFVRRAEARATIQGRPAYFVTGSGGERRLFWNADDAALILSSGILTDSELLQIARTVR